MSGAPPTRVVEELTLNAWPALQTLLYDGWVVRFADGYTRRANSVNPLYRSTLPLAEKVARCEELYGSRGLSTVYKLTAASEPAELDGLLNARGYAREAETIVQLADLSGLPASSDPDVSVVDELPAGWLESLCGFGSSFRHLSTMAAMVRAMAPTAGFAALPVDGETVALGLAVVEGPYVGLFDIVTAPTFRRRGFGERVVTRLLRWGRERGASTGHLAVMDDNAPARRLYAKLGFREAYRYWYRTRPPA
jgi:ribosomal protein S18 acetylase RimI-like enzyme